MEWFRKRDSWEEKFHVLPNKKPINCKFSASHNHEAEDWVETFLTADIKDEIGLQELLRNKEYHEEAVKPISGTVEIHYTTDKTSKQLLDAKATIILLDQDKPFHTHNLFLKAKKKPEQKRKFNTLVE